MRVLRTACLFASFLLVICQCTAGTERDYWPGKKFEIRPPNELGIKSDQLASMERHIKQNLPMMTSVLIMRHGYIAYEKYFKGEMNDLRSLYSETKSVISIMLGIDLGEKWKDTIDMPITALLPDLDPTGSSPAGKISVRNVLSLTSGLPDDGGMGSLNLDAIKIMLSRVQTKKPGEAFAYSGINPDIISIALTKRNNKKASDYAEQMLFKPLEIEKYSWEESYGFSKAAYGLSLRTRDMAKLGYLYLRKGFWKKENIVPESWVAESTRKQVAVGETGVLTQYGLLWWIGSFGGHAGFFAFGYGGQSIAVIPDLDMVIVITTYDSGIPDKYLSIVGEYVIPATAD